ncbi:MAG: phospholipase D-like domain-containing protein, partial [Bdellovibrionota bacterium]
MRRQLFAILLFLSLFAAASARADTYPWVKVGTDDIQVLETPPIDYEFRLALIRSAKTSIDIANYETRADIDPTFPLLTALREAADRGVQIRFITSWIPSELFDNHWFVPGYFMNPPARTPIQFAFSGGTIAQDNGWNLSDSIHEKLMIIDHQIAFTGGRGYGANYLRWIDTGFAMRGPLVAQATQAFEHLWETVLSIQGRFAGSKFWNDSPRLESELEKYSPTAATTLRPDERPRLEHLVQWAHEAPSAAPCGRARLLHFDLLRQLAVRTPTPSEVSYDERAKTLDDPILNALMERLPDAREIRISSLSTILRKDFAQALLRVAKRPGVLVHYIVNAFTPSLTATADT